MQRPRGLIQVAGFIVVLLILTAFQPCRGQEFARGKLSERVWRNFWEISRIPRPSKGETAIAGFVLSRAANLGFPGERDKIGNVLVRVPGTPGRERVPSIALQAHLDMVCVKTASSSHDFGKDPIVPLVRGGWVVGDGTTLGADNGIGVATLLAIMEDRTLKHGPLELLFTVDEEGDFSGAMEIDPRLLHSRSLMNIDSEETHELNLGCAGGQTNVLRFRFPRQGVPLDFRLFSLRISGLRGGHSGVDIHRPRGNAIILLNRILCRAARLGDLRLVSLTGGTVDTAIPAEAAAAFAVSPQLLPQLLQVVGRYSKLYADQRRESDPAPSISLGEIAPGVSPFPGAFSEMDSRQVFEAISAFRNGVQAMSRRFPGMVQTSQNLGVALTSSDSLALRFHLQGTQMPIIRELSRRMREYARTFSGTLEEGTPYPPWEYDEKSIIVQEVLEAHREVFGNLPRLKVVHAGVECGAILEKYPGMDMVSFGPQIENPHTPHERVEIASVEDFWKLVVRVLENRH